MRQYPKLELGRFTQYLNNSNLRLTPGRKEVFDEVMDTHGHFTAEELAKKCQQRQYQVSRASVYRILKELLQAGVIRETAYGQKHQNFEHVYDEKLHHHARCVKCNSMIELPDVKEEQPYHPLLEKEHFHILGHELSFYGICKNCQ